MGVDYTFYPHLHMFDIFSDKKLGFEDSDSGVRLSEGLAVPGSVPGPNRTKLTNTSP